MDRRKNPNFDEGGKRYRCRSGQSGKPSGRPKCKKLTDAYKLQLGKLVPNDEQGRTWAELIAEAQIRVAARGNVQAAHELASRTEGKPSQQLESVGKTKD
jgi:hypothetical protein